MIRLDGAFLAEHGLVRLPDTLGDATLRILYSVLELRVGNRLANQMTDSQLDEFERFMDSNDDAGGFLWLEDNFPHYRDVVAEELWSLGSLLAMASGAIRALIAE